MTASEIVVWTTISLVCGVWWLWIVWFFFVIPRQDRKARLASEAALRKRWDSE
jgi:hypothetical protein